MSVGLRSILANEASSNEALLLLPLLDRELVAANNANISGLSLRNCSVLDKISMSAQVLVKLYGRLPVAERRDLTECHSDLDDWNRRYWWQAREKWPMAMTI